MPPPAALSAATGATAEPLKAGPEAAAPIVQAGEALGERDLGRVPILAATTALQGIGAPSASRADVRSAALACRI